MSCVSSGVAKKYRVENCQYGMAEIASAMEAMGLLPAESTVQEVDKTEVVEIRTRFVQPPPTLMRFQPATKTVCLPHRRLITTFYYDHPATVKMRHCRPDLDDSVFDFQIPENQ